MNKSLEDVFIQATYKPKEALSGSIWQVVCKKQRRRESRLLWSYLSLGIISLTTFVFIIKDISAQFTQSGFYEYASLLSSDSNILTSYWKEFTLSLTESLPLTSITLSLLLLCIMGISLRGVAYRYRSNQLSVA